MARQKKTVSSKKENGKPPWEGFVNWEPNSADKKAIKEMPAEFSVLPTLIHELVDKGYRVSFDWDYRSDCWMVMVQGTTYTCANPGRALSQRHSDMMIAVNSLHHFCAVVTDWQSWLTEDWEEMRFDW